MAVLTHLDAVDGESLIIQSLKDGRFYVKSESEVIQGEDATASYWHISLGEQAVISNGESIEEVSSYSP